MYLLSQFCKSKVWVRSLVSLLQSQAVGQPELLAGGSEEEITFRCIQVGGGFNSMQLQAWVSISLLTVDWEYSDSRGCSRFLICGLFHLQESATVGRLSPFSYFESLCFPLLLLSGFLSWRMLSVCKGFTQWYWTHLNNLLVFRVQPYYICNPTFAL